MWQYIIDIRHYIHHFFVFLYRIRINDIDVLVYFKNKKLIFK